MNEIKLLDHGYIRFVESWGSDARIVEAARMSTAKGFLGWGPNCPNAKPGEEHDHDLYKTAVEGIGGEYEDVVCRKCKHAVEPKAGDEKLLRYLYDNRHDTPFEMAGMIAEVRAPIFVFREWHRHRVPWSYNEASSRYAPLPPLDYVPELQRVLDGADASEDLTDALRDLLHRIELGDCRDDYLPAVERVVRGGGHLTKQAAKADGSKVLTPQNAEIFLEQLAKWQEAGEMLYQRGLAHGIPKELARCAMTVGRFSTMRASSNLRGWMHFLGLRSAPNAQEEIRVYANAAESLLSAVFPRSMSLFSGNRQAGLTPSKASV